MLSNCYKTLAAACFSAVLPCLLNADDIDFHPINFHSLQNQNLQEMMDRVGNTAHVPIGDLTYLGVPFSIPDASKNIYHGDYDNRPNPRGIEIPVGVQGAVKVFTLMNSDWGQPGPQSYAHLEFVGSEGAFFRKDLIGGVDFRDFNQDGFQNVINGTSTQEVWNNGTGQRMDMQQIELPADFADQELKTVRLVDEGGDRFQRMWFNALTIATPSGPPFQLSVEQSGRRCLGVWLKNTKPVRGGEFAIAYQPVSVRPTKSHLGADLPSNANSIVRLFAQNQCQPEDSVEAGLTAAWIMPPDVLLSPGKHEIMEFCFQAAPEAEADPCSSLRFVTCLGVPGALTKNVVTSEDNSTAAAATEEGQVCLLPDLPFIRGDANADGSFDVSDAIAIFGCLFLGTKCTLCTDSADANDDGLFDISDGIFLLSWRFLDGPGPLAPFPNCGTDPSADDLDDCASFSGCP